MRDQRECVICWSAQKERNVCDKCKDKKVWELGGGNKIHQHQLLRNLVDYLNHDRVKYDDKTWEMNFESSLNKINGAVDYIYSSHCFEHVHNIQGLFNYCWEELKSGGILEVVVPHQQSDKAYAIDHVRWFTRETFKSLEYADIVDYGFKPWKILYLEGEKDGSGNLELRCRLTPNK